ncbi:unnamed protein product [Albugo candida]|uniref:Uncharacterized protein n=1 Tax=Albugo candida TaxID=65357 RepID=A0A024GTG1_9STRA|nr:unnamed protein product [Albugo candida]|eukprot:CCI50243.1 unnamed protein product [Albugo candida]
MWLIERRDVSTRFVCESIDKLSRNEKNVRSKLGRKRKALLAVVSFLSISSWSWMTFIGQIDTKDIEVVWMRRSLLLRSHPKDLDIAPPRWYLIRHVMVSRNKIFVKFSALNCWLIEKFSTSSTLGIKAVLREFDIVAFRLLKIAYCQTSRDSFLGTEKDDFMVIVMLEAGPGRLKSERYIAFYMLKFVEYVSSFPLPPRCQLALYSFLPPRCQLALYSFSVPTPVIFLSS